MYKTPRLNSHHVTMHFLLCLAAKDQTWRNSAIQEVGVIMTTLGVGQDVFRCKIGGVKLFCGRIMANLDSSGDSSRKSGL